MASGMKWVNITFIRMTNKNRLTKNLFELQEFSFHLFFKTIYLMLEIYSFLNSPARSLQISVSLSCV